MVIASTGNSRFYHRDGPYDLATIVQAAHGSALHRDVWFSGVAPLQHATVNEVSFLDNRRYAATLTQTLAGAVIVHPDLEHKVPDTTTAIVTSEPYAAWARVAALFHPRRAARPGIHPSAIVSPQATIDLTAEIGPLSIIEDGAEIGPGCQIGANCVVGQGVVIGPDCRIGAQTSISHCLMGARVHVYPGAKIGQDGFGFATVGSGFLSVPQLGLVLIEDDVEIGANTTIDRGSIRDTIIGAGSRLDNLVQIGHNVTIGRCCAIAAQAGIAGSVTIEDFVQIGGQAAIAGHVRIGRGARIAAQAGVMSDVAPASAVVGSPAQPRTEFFRQVATLKKITRRRET
ncbi:UDP-3-O-(3-hydroxymyristoyl)glucosamine N-acyltransferase [Bradyrhizobium prioriisuperbiae]|uniref:UDP-3-O-(3-hydroxymyristoyl)glucosamine N-acyltransferase n=1 Tax=Bradyrhizobium prioriisuperbiae TaxID=2854389 RepID=UPI0028EF9C9F|nr:UDP-3-O-(3-hydroxymyristoyl)glucosamine N-acyltransferase [Bradyrhizobium prioritasuperba]